MAEIKRCFSSWLQRYLCISDGYWRSEKEFNAVFGLWIIKLTCSLKQVDKCIQRAARACLHICFLYYRVLLCHMCVWPRHVKDSSPAELWGHRHDSSAWWLEADMRRLGSFRLLRVCAKDHHKAFFFFWICTLSCVFSVAVSERTRIWCPPWTAGIWFWSKPGGRAETTPPSAISTTTMSLCGWRMWARMSSGFSKRSESELGGRGHATRWPSRTHELTQLFCSTPTPTNVCKNMFTSMTWWSLNSGSLHSLVLKLFFFSLLSSMVSFPA